MTRKIADTMNIVLKNKSIFIIQYKSWTEQNTVRIMMQVTDKLSVRCSRQEEVKGGLQWFLGSLETDSGICHYGLQLNFAFHATCKVKEPAEGDSASDQDPPTSSSLKRTSYIFTSLPP